MLNYQRVHSTWENTNFSNRWVPKNFLCRAARWWGPRYAWPPAAAPRHIWHLRSREGHWAAAGRAFHGNMGAATWRLCRARIYQYFIGISAYQYHRIYIYMTYMIYIYIWHIWCMYIHRIWYNWYYRIYHQYHPRWCSKYDPTKKQIRSSNIILFILGGEWIMKWCTM
jgi:hypothetical protein